MYGHEAKELASESEQDGEGNEDLEVGVFGGGAAGFGDGVFEFVLGEFGVDDLVFV